MTTLQIREYRARVRPGRRGSAVVTVQRAIQPLLATFSVHRYNIKLDLFADSACDSRVDSTFSRHGDHPHDSVSKHQRQLFFTLGSRAGQHSVSHRYARFQQKPDLRIGRGHFHSCAVAVGAQQ